MEHYAGIDVSLESASLCVVDATGRIVREAKVASEPDVLPAVKKRIRARGVGVGHCGSSALNVQRQQLTGVAVGSTIPCVKRSGASL